MPWQHGFGRSYAVLRLAQGGVCAAGIRLVLISQLYPQENERSEPDQACKEQNWYQKVKILLILNFVEKIVKNSKFWP